MHMQFIVLCLLSMSVVAGTGNVGDCSYAPCQQCLGVYYIILTNPSNLTIYEVFTFHADGTFNGISSLSSGDPSLNPPFPPYSNFDGIWKCDGHDRVVVNVFLFFYPTAVSPRSLTNGIHKLQFKSNNRVSGTLHAITYDLASTKNSNLSKWVPIGTSDFNIEGYKLFDRCSRWSSSEQLPIYHDRKLFFSKLWQVSPFKSFTFFSLLLSMTESVCIFHVQIKMKQILAEPIL